MENLKIIKAADILYNSRINIQIIKKGAQIVKYDSVNGQANLNPYQLPFVFTRRSIGRSGNYIIGMGK